MTNSSLHVSARIVDFFNEEEKKLYMVVNFIAIGSIVAVFGIITNIINIVIFYRQGLASSTINISFTGLAVSDLCGLLILSLHNLCFNPLFVNAGLPVVPDEVQHLTGGLLHLCCTRITGWITVYITAERCLCIATPLKIKRILTPRRAAFIILFIYFITIMPLAPEYLILYLDWRFYPGKNSTLLSLFSKPHDSILDGLTFLLFGIYMIASFLLVGFFTSVLVVKLKLKTKRRSEVTVQNKQSEMVSNRDKKTMNMVIVIAVAMVIFYTPSVIITVLAFVVPEFSTTGLLSNSYFIAWSFGVLFEVVHSSISLVMYYTMSSKYRKTFHQFFSCKKKRLT